MKSRLGILGGFALLAMISCGENNNVRSWSDSQIDQWLAKSRWAELSITPFDGFNKRAFVEQNVLNPKSWEVAYDFLKNQSLNELPQGRIELSNDGTFATVTDYITKDSANFEAHRKYIDIQYVASGEEYIYVTSLDDRDETIKPYDAQKDIELFKKADCTQCLANASNFVVLFPSDGHKPCIKVGQNGAVRKIVIKIPMFE